MSRSGLFRAAALLAAGAAPLLAGAANAAEVPQLNSGLPEVGADKLVSGATQLVTPFEAASGVQLPQLGAPALGDLPVPALPSDAAQERSVRGPIGDLPNVKTPDAHGGNTRLGSVRAPVPSAGGLPTAGSVTNPTVLSGVLPTING